MTEMIKNCINCLDSIAVNKKYCLCSYCNIQRRRKAHIMAMNKYYINNQGRILEQKQDYYIKKMEGKERQKVGRKRIHNNDDKTVEMTDSIKHCVSCLDSIAVNKKYCLCSLCYMERKRETKKISMKIWYNKNHERLLEYKKQHNRKVKFLILNGMALNIHHQILIKL